ncbi:MAG: ATP synthase subunit I [Bacillaceae bacterium]|nr:ATP synthase subunit I [Bacillaceae bacterium]
MNDFWIPVKRVMVHTLIVLLLAVLARFILPYPLFWQGFMLGTSVSLINGLILMKRTWQAGEAAESGKRARSTGMLQRFAAAAFAVLVTLEYPQYFSLGGTIAGFAVLPILSLVVFIFYYYIRHTKAGK